MHRQYDPIVHCARCRVCITWSQHIRTTEMSVLPMPVLPNLFSTAAHFLGTAHQTAHCIYGAYFRYKTYILLHIFSFVIQKYIKFVFAKLNCSFLQAALSTHLFYIQELHIITYFSKS